MNKQEIFEYLKSQEEQYSEKFGIKFIGLFGSFVRDEADDESDIDILYVKSQNGKRRIQKGILKNC